MLLYLTCHAATVYKVATRMQGRMPHIPLIRADIAPAEAMEIALAALFGPGADIDIWASPAGRTLQTVAIVAKHLVHYFFDTRSDRRQLEIHVSRLQCRRYAGIVADQAPIICPDGSAFNLAPPGSEFYPAARTRLQAWLADLTAVISHRIALRVLRGLLAGVRDFEGVTLAYDAPQGTVLQDGTAAALHMGARHAGARGV